MKKIHVIFWVLFIWAVAPCVSQVADGQLQVLNFNIQKPFLLIPIQDSAADINMCIEHAEGKNPETFYVRLARNKIDYWIKLDVKKYSNKALSITFFNCPEKALGLKNIKQSDNFEFEYYEKYRPEFHFSPEYGWMNDPNGMVYFDGEYHLFFQYNPYGNKWGNMHWGHAVSTNLTNWTYLPVAIGIDSLGDVFSGSTVIDKNNTAGFGKNAMVAIYTSNGKTQQQSLAYSTDKGRTFTKYTGNPVLRNPGIVDFRDPKVFWCEQTNQWVMALATYSTITFYGSVNLKNWLKLSEFSCDKGAHGGVWECPDLFPLNYRGQTKWVLLVSINPGGPNGGSATQYFVGSFDGKTFTADNLDYPLWLDYGRDNYAGVTFSNIPKTDDRRVFLAWMSNWDYANEVPTKSFRNAMTLPRELSLKFNGKQLILANKPIDEVSKLRTATKNIAGCIVKNQVEYMNVLTQTDGAFEIEMEIEPLFSVNFGFSIYNSVGDTLSYNFDLEKKTLTADRHNSGLTEFSPKFASSQTAPLLSNKKYKIRLIVDKASSEMFLNNCNFSMTDIVFPKQNFQNICVFTSTSSVRLRHLKIHKVM